MQNINQARKMDRTYLSIEELEVAVSDLSRADIFRLKAIAKQYTGNHAMEADDLVQEAVLRTLSETRKTCPRGLPIVNFLAGAMRSIASGEREKKDPAGKLCDNIELCQLPDPDNNPEYILLEKQLFNQMEEIFEEDEEILLLIFYLQEGESPSEIQEKEEWSETHYNSIRRRMRRKWNAHENQEKVS